MFNINLNLKIEYKNDDNWENKTIGRPADQVVFLTATNAKRNGRVFVALQTTDAVKAGSTRSTVLLLF